MPEVGRWLFYPTFYRSKFPSLLGWVFFIFLFPSSLLTTGEADFLANSKSDKLLLNTLRLSLKVIPALDLPG